MGVVAFPNLIPNAVAWELRSITGVSQSPLGGPVRTLSRPGSRWAAKFEFRNLTLANAALLRSFLSSLDGMANRFYVRDHSYTKRGSFAATELTVNGDFSNGTTSWSVTAGWYALTAADGVVRSLRIRGMSGGPYVLLPAVVASVTQYAPYCVRFLAHQGVGDFTALALYETVGGSGVAAGFSPGLIAAAHSPRNATMRVGLYDASAVGANLPGDFTELSRVSLARCALVDNGPNLLTRSDEFDDAVWSVTRATISATKKTAPDGGADGDTLAEDGTAASQHYIEHDDVTVSASTVLDYTYGVYLRADNRNFAQLILRETTGPSDVYCFFDLLTGTVGAIDVGANWASPRATITAAGNSWFYCTLTARKTNAATVIQPFVFVAASTSSNTFDGLTQDSIAMWRATLAQSSVPTRAVLTTALAVAATAQAGAGLYVKGLPVSTNGLLLVGDWVQLIGATAGQFVRVTKPLNSDAAGRGFLAFEPTLNFAPADNDAVVVGEPWCRFMLDSTSVEWSVVPGGFHTATFTAVEDIAP